MVNGSSFSGIVYTKTTLIGGKDFIYAQLENIIDNESTFSKTLEATSTTDMRRYIVVHDR